MRLFGRADRVDLRVSALQREGGKGRCLRLVKQTEDHGTGPRQTCAERTELQKLAANGLYNGEGFADRGLEGVLQ